MVAFLSKPIESEGFEQIAKTVNGEVQLQTLVDGKKIVITKSTIRRDLQLEDAEVFLEQQVSEMSSHKRINETPSHTKKIFGNMRRVGKGFSGRETPLFQTMLVQDQADMGEDNVADEAVNEEMNDSLVRAATTASSLEAEQDSGAKTPWGILLLELGLREYLKLPITHCSVLDLENIKTAQAREISSLKLRVKKLEKKDRKRTHKGRKIHDIDADEDITPENVHDAEMFDVNNLQGDEVCVEKEVPVKEVSVVGKVNDASIATIVIAATITEVAITLAQAQAELKSTRPKAKGLVIHEQEQAPTPTPIELAQRLQVEEQEELTVDEKATLFQQLLEKRRKHFATKRPEEKRNRPPTKAQQRNTMCTYLKNMDGWKPKVLKNNSFANIQELFEKAMKRVNTFVDFRTKLVEGTKNEEGTKKAKVEVIEGSSKRARDELEQENAKKQKVDDDQEAAKMKELMKIIPDEEEVAIDAIPLATKPPSIVDWKIIKE
ncbi:hypothetical protein Tco_1407705 [Tanacetum coccineum]